MYMYVITDKVIMTDRYMYYMYVCIYICTGLHWLWGCLEALPAAVGTGTAVGVVSRHVGGCGQKQDVVGRSMYVWVWLCGKMEQHAKGK